MANAADTAASFETPEDAGKGDAGLVNLWLEAIRLQRKTEETWRKKAQRAVDRYRDEEDRRGKRFNILFANVATVLPAVYNSTPIPDVRRRFGDADEVGKIAAQVLERSLSYMADAYDFDGTMRAICWDGEVAGRGVPWVRYEPTVTGEGDEARIVGEAVTCEYVDWRDFIRGPGRRWSEVPWIGREHRLTREELTERFGPVGQTMPLDFVMDGAQKGDPREVPDVFKRGTVYEIWDKASRRVLFLAPSVPEKPLKAEDDPLGLKDFFPVPRPYYTIPDTGSLVPLVPFELYRDQAEELDRVTARITALVNVLRYRGVRASDLVELSALADAKDGDFVPVQNWQQFAGTAGGGLEKAFYTMPIEGVVAVVRELVLHREQIKQVIYEITGLSDILRGATQASETATAQQIKAQWGSLRIQERQAEIQRLARDLFRMKAEIIAEKFQPETLAAMTGTDLPDGQVKAQAQAAAQQVQQAGQPVPEELAQILQTPSWDEVMAVLRSDAMRAYRVDIETDSTIQADVARSQENAARFVEGFGGFVQSVGPAVMQGFMPVDVATDLLTSFARQFKLGRQAEDALDRMGARPPQPPADPGAAEAEAKKAEADIKREEITAQERMKDKELASQEKIARRQIASQERLAGIEPAPYADEVLAQQVGEAMQQIVAQIGSLEQTIRALAEDQAAPAQVVARGPDGRAAAVRKGRRVMQVVRGPDGMAEGLA